MPADLTDDWSDDDLGAYRDFCAACLIADLTVPITVWANESNNRTVAHNPKGNASGLFQLMPQTAHELGYDTQSDMDLSAFRRLSVSGQLDWARAYYGVHRGQIATVARFYLCTFLPALLPHGDDMTFVLCARNGPFAWAYDANSAFDREGKGSVLVSDLVAAANRAVGPRTRELLSRVEAASV